MQVGTRSTRSLFDRATAVLVASVLMGSVLSAAAFSAPAAFAAPGDSPRAVISQELKRRLAESPTGRVKAVVTAWRRQDLAAIRSLGVEGTTLRYLPMILARGVDATLLAKLQASPLVRSVYPNRGYRLFMEDTTWITGARYAWGGPMGAAGTNYRGTGVHVAEIDTGVDGAHEDADNLVEFCDTSVAVSGTANQVACSPFTPGSGNVPLGSGTDARLDSFDDEGHGSHVFGTIAGTGDASGGIDARHSTMGIAPEAKGHVYSANIATALLPFHILAAYDDMTYKKANGFTQVVLTSNSFGGGDGANYDPNDPQNVAIKAAFDKGILSVYAAGNSGPEHNTLSDTCVNPWVVCVGATTKPDSVAMFSSRGRPSEPADTNRNGVVGDNGDNGTPNDPDDDIPPDVAPDNHDRALGQRLEIGLYRPTIVAPGVSINSISAFLGPANEAGPCSEAAPVKANCYEALQGTSMATPHVSGAIALIVEAYRDGHNGATPSPNQIIDILERSADKLPGWEAEEQGAGRLNVLRAVRHARVYPDGPPRPNFGTPSPPYAPNRFPGAPATKAPIEGCAPTAGFATGMADVHQITVAERTERLRVSISAEDQDANMYMMLWRPGIERTADGNPPGPTRAFPDQEATGLLNDDNLPINPNRFVDVRAPEEGVWTLEVFHRASGAPDTCGGFSYTGTIERTISATAPTVAFSSPPAGSTHTDRFITFKGTAGYPTRWNGVTNWQVPGTAGGLEGIIPNEFLTLHLHGNTEDGCTGDGHGDLVSRSVNPNCRNGPFLSQTAALASTPAASWKMETALFDGTNGRTIYDPNWIWNVTEPTYVGGPMTVSFWASAESSLGELWRIALWTDYGTSTAREAFSTIRAANTTGTQLVQLTVNLPLIRAQSNFVLHIDPYQLDQANTFIYYDSQSPCPGGSGPCDSTVSMPIVVPGVAAQGGEAPTIATPDNLRVTDLHSRLRLAWSPADGATQYRIHRSTNPAFVPGEGNEIATTSGVGCTSPSVPSWPSASRSGALCYDDASVTPLRTYYYRIVGVGITGATSDESALVYGQRTLYDRQIRVRGTQLYGAGYWEFGVGLNDPVTQWRYRYDTLERPDGTNSWTVSARSYTQGIGSAKVDRAVNTEGVSPVQPRDPGVVLTKSGPATAAPGSNYSYRISWHNLGPEDASRARLTDTLPRGIGFVSASGGGVWDRATRTVTWRLGTVSVGEKGSVTLNVRVPAGTPAGALIVNRADFTAPLTVANPGIAATVIR